VDETLTGRGFEINQCNLGVRAFHRGPELNPRADPVVHVRTNNLRARLAQYYAPADVSDPVAIELTGRTYVGAF
jgi:hypothetical protein